MEQIDLNHPVAYRHSSFRRFHPGERHVTRRCEEDVLLLVSGGVLRFSEDGSPVEVSPGEYYIQRRGKLQRGEEESDRPQYFYVHFLAEWGGGNGLPARGRFSYERIYPLMKQLSALSFDQNAALIDRLAVFYQLLSALRAPLSPQAGDLTAKGILSDLTADLKCPPSLEQLSAKHHFSKNQIIALFKKEYGLSPYRYLMKVRLDHAVWLLKTSLATLDTIAEESGFGDYVSFYKAFVKAYGTAPGRYRERLVSG